MNFYTQFNRPADKGEINKGQSMTAPDQALTMRQIVQRFVQGRPLPSSGEPVYHEDYVPDFKRLDLVEIDEYVEHINERVKTLKQEAKRQASRFEEKEPERQLPPDKGAIALPPTQ